MKPRHLVLGLALAIAALLAAFGDKTPDADVAEAVERPAASATSAPATAPVAAASAGPASSARAPAILRLQPRDELIGDGVGADENDLFARQDWTPPPPPPPQESGPPPPPPVAPRLPYTFIGKSLEEGKWEVYLASGERTHIAVEGGVIDGAWRVERIAPPLLTLTYLPLNQVQQLNIGAFD